MLNSSSIASEVKHKVIHEKGYPGMLASVVEIFELLHLKILSPKQMLQRLPIALTLVEPGNTYENLLIEIRQLYIICIDQKKLLKKDITI